MKFPFMGGGKKVWESPAIKQMMEISDFKDSTVLLKDKRALAVIKINPINFGILSRDQQDSVIYGFLEFVNNLTHPVQIIMRSVNIDLDDYLNELKSRIVKRDDKMALAYYEHFSEYLKGFIRKREVHERLFYLVIPAVSQGAGKSTLKKLDAKCLRIMSGLSTSGIVSERLNTQQLKNFYSSYFTQTFEIQDTYISPQTVYKKMWEDTHKKDDRGIGKRQAKPPSPKKQKADEKPAVPSKEEIIKARESHMESVSPKADGTAQQPENPDENPTGDTKVESAIDDVTPARKEPTPLDTDVQKERQAKDEGYVSRVDSMLFDKPNKEAPIPDKSQFAKTPQENPDQDEEKDPKKPKDSGDTIED